MTDDFPEYIGDGVYAYFDGYHIILQLTAQDPVHRIALEPAVWKQLVKYQAAVTKATTL